MQWKYMIFQKIVVSSSIVVVCFIALNIIININSSLANPVNAQIDISGIIETIKSENIDLNLVYENDNMNDIYSLVYIENNQYKSYIIDKRQGKEITFQDLIQEDQKEAYNQKELELLKLKYPTFITDILINQEGKKVYYVKDQEVTIYYYDYTFDYDYQEEVSLTINYNEIKDYLNFTPIFNEEYQNEDGYNYSSSKKTVALTFDDGPSAKYNAKILEVLAQNKAHATFFMVGTMMNACQKCVLDTYKSGNEIGSHTYEHMNIKTNEEKKVSESLNKVNELYYQITNDTIKLLRPPYGAYNTTNLKNISVPFILWNLDTEDWRYRDVDHIVNYIVENAQDGSIILMHELYETSYEALKIALPKLYAMGYQVVSVSELATLKGQNLENGHAYRYFK